MKKRIFLGLLPVLTSMTALSVYQFQLPLTVNYGANSLALMGLVAP